MEYLIIEDDDCIVFENKVDNQILKGWIPIGGVSTPVTRDNDGYSYYCYVQAMVKTSDNG